MTGAEIAVVPDGHAVNPATGELLPLARGGTDELAGQLREVRELEGRLREYKSAISRELLHRMDRAAKWTVRYKGWKVEGDAPPKPDYDGAVLARELGDLVKAGIIDVVAHVAAVEAVEQWKPKKAGINALLKLGSPEITAALARAEVPASKTRTVRVTDA